MMFLRYAIMHYTVSMLRHYAQCTRVLCYDLHFSLCNLQNTGVPTLPCLCRLSVGWPNANAYFNHNLCKELDGYCWFYEYFTHNSAECHQCFHIIERLCKVRENKWKLNLCSVRKPKTICAEYIVFAEITLANCSTTLMKTIGKRGLFSLNINLMRFSSQWNCIIDILSWFF